MVTGVWTSWLLATGLAAAAPGPDVGSAGAPDAVAGEALVDLADDLSDQDVASLEQSLGVHLVPNSILVGEDRVYRLVGRVTDRLLQRLRQDPRVEAAEPNFIYGLPETNWAAAAGPEVPEPAEGGAAFPNDPLYRSQWHMHMINMERAWQGGRGKGAVVAVIDTGISDGKGKLPRVPDLEGTRFVPGYNFVDDNGQPDDDHGHGTHVAGTIAERTNNEFGVAGVAPEVALMPIKVLSRQGYGTAADIAEGIRWAAKNGAHVINMSLGGGGYSAAMAKAVKFAHDKGVVVVCAAGNTGRGKVEYPAAYPGALAVSAVGPDGKKAWYSSYGKEVFVAAPGGDTRVDLNGDGIADGVLQDTIAPGDPTRHGFFPFQGTSMATPHVAGAAALLVAAGVTNPDAVAKVLAESAQPRAERDQYGNGVLDAGAAMKSLDSQKQVTLGAAWLALAAISVLARRRGRDAVKLGLGGVVAAAVGSVGLYPLLGLLGDSTPVQLLASPLPAWDGVLLGPSWGPTPLLASVALPLAAAVLLLGVTRLRGVLVGLAVGVGTYLLACAITGNVNVHFIPGTGFLDGAWLVVNGALCLGLARLLARR